MRHAVLAAALAFTTSIRPRIVPAATRPVARLVMAWLDRRRAVADAAEHGDEAELWTPER
jgi:hypothetical protein